MDQHFSEDALMIAGNILSGNNACGTLQQATASGDAAYFAAAAEAVLKVRRDELEYARKQRETALKSAEGLRFTLELLVQNLFRDPINPGRMSMTINNNIIAIVEKALNRKIPWDST